MAKNHQIDPISNIVLRSKNGKRPKRITIFGVCANPVARVNSPNEACLGDVDNKLIPIK